MKAPDWMTMSLCRECHQKVHEDPEMWAHQYPWLLRTVQKAFEDGALREG